MLNGKMNDPQLNNCMIQYGMLNGIVDDAYDPTHSAAEHP